MKSNQRTKILRRYALWVIHTDTNAYISSNLFNSPAEAVSCFKGMPDFCRHNGDEAGAKQWEQSRAEVIVVDIAVPDVKGGAR